MKKNNGIDLFTIINNILYEKVDRWYEYKNVYNAYMMNKWLGMDNRTIRFADVMNQSQLSPEIQYRFYLRAIPRGGRKLNWVKKEKNEDIDFICGVYKVNKTVGKQYSRLLNPEQMKMLKDEYTLWGRI